MMNIQDRASEYDFWAWIGSDTIDVVYARVEALLAGNRRMTVIRQDMQGDGRIEAVAGLTIVDGGPLKEVTTPRGGVLLRVMTTPGIDSFSLHSDPALGTEADARRRFGSDKPRDAIYVEITGRGTGGMEDRIEIAEWNSHGYGQRTVVVFDESLARDKHHAAAALTVLAEGLREHAQERLR